MSSSDETSRPGRPASGGSATEARSDDDRPTPRDQEMGAALRSVYQRAVNEKVPDEMMDLLGKLG